MKLLLKQEHALYYLNDSTTTEVLYGGAAGGGKSAFGVLWLIANCQKYAGTRWLMGRSVLKTLKETTLNTFFDLSNKLNLTNQWIYNEQKGLIKFNNGSEIILKDLYQYPSDKNFDNLGSLEITGAFIDECNQIVFKAWQVVKSRMRYKLKEFAPNGELTKNLKVVEKDIDGNSIAWKQSDGKITNGLIPKQLGSCNPAKNWVYNEFFKPNRSQTLKPFRKFVIALPKDNPHLPKSYLDSLLEMEKPSRERLYYGNWEYDDNPNMLIDRMSIEAIFGLNVGVKGNKYITADIARFGSDKAVILVWDGWVIIEMIEFDISKTTDIQACIQALRIKHNIPLDRVICDEDGVGGGVVDSLGCKGFVNGSTPLLDPENDNSNNYFKEQYINLQSQCGYKLAKHANARDILFSAEISEDTKQSIIEELEQLQTWKTDADGKLRIKPKAEIKTDIGHSPDYRDALLMRAYFDYDDFVSQQNVGRFFNR